jgi:hypothetical protein
MAGTTASSRVRFPVRLIAETPIPIMKGTNPAGVTSVFAKMARLRSRQRNREISGMTQ